VAWLLSKPEVTAPVVGVSKVSQLEQLVAATAIELDDSDIQYLEELYQPVENLLSVGMS
jgi:aryl-alcohol dehydrogenase-like predicted oxidoreductase